MEVGGTGVCLGDPRIQAKLGLNLSKITFLDIKIEKNNFLTPANAKNQDGTCFLTKILFFGFSSVTIDFCHILPPTLLKELVLVSIVVKFDGLSLIV